MGVKMADADNKKLNLMRNEKLIQLRKQKLYHRPDGQVRFMTQDDLRIVLKDQYKIKISTSYISQLERGKIVPIIKIAHAISDFFGLTVDELFPKKIYLCNVKETNLLVS